MRFNYTLAAMIITDKQGMCEQPQLQEYLIRSIIDLSGGRFPVNHQNSKKTKQLNGELSWRIATGNFMALSMRIAGQLNEMEWGLDYDCIEEPDLLSIRNYQALASSFHCQGNDSGFNQRSRAEDRILHYVQDVQ